VALPTTVTRSGSRAGCRRGLDRAAVRWGARLGCRTGRVAAVPPTPRGCTWSICALIRCRTRSSPGGACRSWPGRCKQKMWFFWKSLPMGERERTTYTPDSVPGGPLTTFSFSEISCFTCGLPPSRNPIPVNADPGSCPHKIASGCGVFPFLRGEANFMFPTSEAKNSVNTCAPLVRSGERS
jgi:hypothetical protein